MPKPEQGSWYTVAYGDTTRTISRLAYGRDLSAQIVSANYDTLKDRALSLEGLPTLYSGDKLFIPPYKNRYNNEQITADFDNQIMVDFNGVRFPGVKASRIGRQMNQIANGFVFEIPYDYHDKKMVDLLRPYTWFTARLYIGGELYITALASKWDYQESDSGTTAVIETRSLPGEMLDCMGMRKSMVFKSGMTLLDICREVSAPYGITCYSSNGSGGVVTQSQVGDAFNRVEQDITQPDAEFLTDLARQKGFLLTSMLDGNLLLCRANTEDRPVCSLIAGVYPVRSFKSSHDGSKRFSKFVATTEEAGISSISATLQDTNVKRNRTMVFKASESEEANLKTACEWRRSKSIAEAATFDVEVSGWRNPEGELWTENMKVTGLAPGAFVFTESEFIIESAELTKDDNGGDVTALKLAIPEAYTTTQPKAPFPWDGYYRKGGPRGGSGTLEIL